MDKVLPALLSIASAVLGVGVGGDVLAVDLGGDELLLGDGDAGDDDDSQGHRVDGGVDGVEEGEGHEAGSSSDSAEMHVGGWVEFAAGVEEQKRLENTISFG